MYPPNDPAHRVAGMRRDVSRIRDGIEQLLAESRARRAIATILDLSPDDEANVFERPENAGVYEPPA